MRSHDSWPVSDREGRGITKLTLTLIIGTIAVTSAGAGGRADSGQRISTSLSTWKVAGAGNEPGTTADPPADYVPRKAYLYQHHLAVKRLRLLGARERRIVALLTRLRIGAGTQRHVDSASKPGSSPVRRAICSVFGAHCSEALRVAWCESRWNVHATNGQYWGLFQFGSFARAHYGFAWNAWAQARSAYRYFLDAGWSPWTCRP